MAKSKTAPEQIPSDSESQFIWCNKLQRQKAWRNCPNCPFFECAQITKAFRQRLVETGQYELHNQSFKLKGRNVAMVLFEKEDGSLELSTLDVKEVTPEMIQSGKVKAVYQITKKFVPEVTVKLRPVDMQAAAPTGNLPRTPRRRSKKEAS